MNKDITNFVNDTLYPLIFEKVNTLFPEMSFKWENGKWLSPKNIDGTEPKTKRPDKCIITKKKPTRVKENGDGGSKDLISLYMDLNHLDFIGAVKAICKDVNVELPEPSSEDAERYKAYQKQQDEREYSLQRQKEALWSSKGTSVLMYLRDRGWSREDIEKAELGFIDEEEARAIKAQGGIGSDYTLSIPLRSRGRLYGFKFRTISKEVETAKGKYKYLIGTKRTENLFGLTGLNDWTDIVVVEGELDALHAQVKGVKNIVATSGGYLTTDLLRAAQEKGIRKVTLLLDNDKAGEKYIKQSIEAAEQMNITPFVATISDAKDVDEYLKSHSIEELTKIINEADTATHYLFVKLIEEAIKAQGGEDGTLTPKQYAELQDKVIALANHTKDDTERDKILSEFSYNGGERITKEALLAWADKQREIEDALTQKESTGTAIKEISELYQSGRIQEAISKMKDASNSLNNIDRRSKYSSLLSLPSENEIVERMKKRQDAIPTMYQFSRGVEKEVLTIPSGAITFVCAPTSHGKSTMLQNLALQVAEQANEGETTLYFTFEEDKDSVFVQMLNKSMNIDLCKNYDANSSNNLRALSHFYRTGEDRYIKADKKDEFHQKRSLFVSKYISSGKLRLFYEDYDSAELIEAIKYIGKQVKIKAVFIDYIQLLNNTEYRAKRMVRTEELKEICKDLKNLAVGYDLPIVVAAQMNRETKSPIDMHSQNIAEAADLERIANKIICIWNSSFTAQKSEKNGKELNDFESNKMRLGVGGKIYAKLTKNRGGVVGLDAVLDYIGNTGVIVHNYKQVPTKEADLQFEEMKSYF
ncbi:MAG: DnaB-like helicase C-terminal domain-containing protein [Bacteroidales bacterium]|nr:DnaB-like helicase C-terminal domain-containing protein [Bacteroidales bacterium]